jgi:hypothetical protein
MTTNGMLAPLEIRVAAIIEREHLTGKKLRLT